MRISVALATHDGERYLLAQLRSIARQTRLPDELVLCDDGSSDGTLRIVEQFRREAPFPVRVLPPASRAGPHESFIRAAADCGGDAIAFCDQDDVWLEHKLECCADALSRGDAMLVVHSASVMRHDLRPTGRSFPRARRSRVVAAGEVYPWITCPGFAIVFVRSLLDWGDWAGRPRSRYWSGPMTHDEWAVLLASAAGRTAFLRDRLVLYRQHPDQLFGAPDPREALTRLRASPPEADDEAAELLEEHAAYLRRLAAGLGATSAGERMAQNLQRAAELREHSARIRRRRALLHRRDRGRSARLRTLAGLVGAGGYRQTALGGLGRLALAHDAVRVLSQRR